MVLRKKNKIYVDITFKDGVYEIGQRLTSFFGQTGIFENTEKITRKLDFFFKHASLNFLTFDEDLHHEYEHLDNFMQKDFELNEELENEDDYDEDTNGDENLSQKHVIFLPLTIFFYFSEKKSNFFILPEFKKKYKKDTSKLPVVITYLNYKEKNFSLFNKFFYYEKIKEYIKIHRTVKNIYSFNNTFYKLLNLSSLDFFIDEDLNSQFHQQYIFFYKKRKKRIFFFKKHFIKKKRAMFYVSKKINSLSNKFLLTMAVLKLTLTGKKYNYSDYLNIIYNLVSQLYTSKKYFFKRFKRKKRFKLTVMRNFMGNKISYYKIYSYTKQKKKKK